MKDTLLGKKNSIPLDYDPNILRPLSRLESRIKSGLDEYSNFLHGEDYWTSYETSWLNGNGIPRNKILNVSYSCESKFFIESKSFKLYLYSLNNKKFDSTKEVVSLIKNDLETALKSGEIVEAVEFQIPEKANYQKHPNPASRYAIIGVFVAKHKKDVNVAVTGAKSCVYIDKDLSKKLSSSFSASSIEGIEVKASGMNSDMHASAEYRANLVSLYAKKAVEAC